MSLASTKKSHEPMKDVEIVGTVDEEYVYEPAAKPLPIDDSCEVDIDPSIWGDAASVKPTAVLPKPEILTLPTLRYQYFALTRVRGTHSSWAINSCSYDSYEDLVRSVVISSTDEIRILKLPLPF